MIQEARQFLAWLEGIGVQATVVKGDVASKQDVERAVNGSWSTIKGVIQAPLELNVSNNLREKNPFTNPHDLV